VTQDLLFAWEPRRSRHLAIAGFLALSAAGHAFCFYLFQIVYPPTVALLPPPARVNFISNNSDEGRTLLRWVAAEDPALATTTQRSPDAKAFLLPKLAHVPSYSTLQPALKRWLFLKPDAQSPSARPPAPVPIARTQNQAAHLSVPTSIVFANKSDSLGQVQSPSMKFSASTRESPQNATFRIALAPDGTVHYCFLENSSGDSGLDEEARVYLLRSRFEPQKNPAERDSNDFKWTTVTIEWGNDVAIPAAPPTSATSP
jgi:hypothetical protein